MIKYSHCFNYMNYLDYLNYLNYIDLYFDLNIDLMIFVFCLGKRSLELMHAQNCIK